MILSIISFSISFNHRMDRQQREDIPPYLNNVYKIRLSYISLRILDPCQSCGHSGEEFNASCEHCWFTLQSVVHELHCFINWVHMTAPQFRLFEDHGASRRDVTYDGRLYVPGIELNSEHERSIYREYGRVLREASSDCGDCDVERAGEYTLCGGCIQDVEECLSGLFSIYADFPIHPLHVMRPLNMGLPDQLNEQ